MWNENNMPVGVQIVSDIGKEGLLLRIASQLELLNPWAKQWPTPIEKSV
jgi:Asp-tRNA(Asn)/Glu-tRNA(Gln) amidotransferase A subunit family amidase